MRKPDSVARLNPGQTDTETEGVPRCSHCSQKPCPVNTLVNDCSSNQLGENTFSDFKMKISLARYKIVPLLFHRMGRREWEAFTEDVIIWSLAPVMKLS